ncbi:MAG: transcriptional repressor [Bacteroidota bacterium]
MHTVKQVEDNRQEVKRNFIAYLEKMNQRKTPERFAILDEIYMNEIYLDKKHFDAESLFLHMKNNNYRLSRATVYNTLDLLVECGLVTKHQFGENITKYEAGLGNKQHDHLICNKCNKVLEFCDPRIQQIKNMMGELLHFEITHHSLHLFGDPKLDANGKCIACEKEVK